MPIGRPHPEWHSEIKRLEQVGDETAAEVLLLEICDATEAESRVEGYGVAPAAYERLAVIYRKRKDHAAEIAILERYESAPHAPGATPEKLAERLAKLRRCTCAGGRATDEADWPGRRARK